MGARVWCWLSGEAGVGKSRLVTEFSMVVARRAAWSPRPAASERPVGSRSRRWPTGCAPQLRAAEAALEPVWRDEVERLVAARLPARRRSSDALHAKADAWQRLRFFEGLARAVLVADRPTMLVLDDLQWCDNDTMLWVVFLLGLARRRRCWSSPRRATTSSPTTSTCWPRSDRSAPGAGSPS